MESAINLALTDSAIPDRPIEKKEELFNPGSDSVILFREIWGATMLERVTVFNKKISQTKIFFSGSVFTDSFNCGLYISDKERPVIVSDQVKILGPIYAPKAGLKSTNSQDETIKSNNALKVSANELPFLVTSITNHLKGNLLFCFDTVLQKKSHEFTGSDSLTNSFLNETAVYFQKRKLTTGNSYLKGRIVLISDSLIEITATSHLEDIIVAAPVIRIQAGFSGSLQALASDSLIVEEDCRLRYPSLLCLQKSDDSQVQNRMEIHKNCIVEGQIVAICNSNDFYKSVTEIDEGVTVKGIVYTKGYLNLRAKVCGEVMTDYFIRRSPAATFENQLDNTEINRTLLPDFFLGFSIFPSGEKKILKWLQ